MMNFRHRVTVLIRHAVIGHIAIFRLAFALALELVFFLAFFRQLLLTLFIGVIGSCHSLLS